MEPTSNTNNFSAKARSAFSDVKSTIDATGEYIKTKKPTLAGAANSAINAISSPEFGSYGKKLHTADDVVSYYGKKAAKVVSGIGSAVSAIKKIKKRKEQENSTNLPSVIPNKQVSVSESEQKRYLSFKEFLSEKE